MRKAVIGALVLVIVVAWGLLALLGVDWLARHAINRWGSTLLAAEVDVERVNLSMFKGTAFVKGVEVGRVPGFNVRTAHMDELRVRLDPATVLSGPTLVHEFAVTSLQVTYERGDRGSNLDAIQRNIEAAVRSSGEGGTGKAGGRRYVIERLVIRNLRVVVSHQGLPGGQALAFDLPDVELRDIGKRDGGLTANQVAALVTATLHQKVALRVLSNLDALRRGGLEGAIDALRRLVK
jgi:hypothetical protein